jgi:hypothetical protein
MHTFAPVFNAPVHTLVHTFNAQFPLPLPHAKLEWKGLFLGSFLTF